MAIFGNIEAIKKQVIHDKFQIAFDYLSKVLDETSQENKRLKSYDLNVFEKIILDENNFALEQTYNSKDRKDCFFESHKKYIDVQFILEGEEIIEVIDTDCLIMDFKYDSEEMDLIKYNDTLQASQIVLKKGDVAIFYPQDAHMPCVKIDKDVKILKTVVKIAV